MIINDKDGAANKAEKDAGDGADLDDIDALLEKLKEESGQTVEVEVSTGKKSKRVCDGGRLLVDLGFDLRLQRVRATPTCPFDYRRMRYKTRCTLEQPKFLSIC